MRTLGALCHRSNVRSPRFRRGPFVRDVVFDHGRASAPRITGPHMLPSTLLTVSASAEFWFSRLNSTPHTITVYASQPPSPATTQHSLPGARYGLPGPVSHRQDHASFAWRTSNPAFSIAAPWIASLALRGHKVTVQTGRPQGAPLRHFDPVGATLVVALLRRTATTRPSCESVN